MEFYGKFRAKSSETDPKEIGFDIKKNEKFGMLYINFFSYESTPVNCLIGRTENCRQLDLSLNHYQLQRTAYAENTDLWACAKHVQITLTYSNSVSAN